MLARTMPLLPALMMISACGSAGGRTSPEMKTGRCFAMSLVFSDLVKVMGASAREREAIARIRIHFTTKFQNAVADVATRGGDVNSLSEQTKAFLEEVKESPLKWESDFRDCTKSAIADLGQDA